MVTTGSKLNWNNSGQASRNYWGELQQYGRENMYNKERFEKGRQARHEIVCADLLDKLLASAGGFTMSMQKFVTE
jgi:hypothetical protein